MTFDKWLWKAVFIFLALATLICIFLFPVIAEEPYTYSQAHQNKEATMQKYKDDWQDTTIRYKQHPNQQYAYGEQVAFITIPKMDIYELPIYYGSDPINNNWQITAPGHTGNWSMFGEHGVTCVGAHNYQLFKNLKLLEPGDKILIETEIDRYVYVVDETGVYHNKTDNWDKTATKHKHDYALNLMTCFPFDAIKTKDMYIVYTSLQRGTIFEK
ncbi:MAG: sortase [Coprobacillus sp.]